VDAVRKFLLSPGIWSSLFPVIGIARATKEGRRDWRVVLMWLSWGISVALAVGTVLERSRQAELDELEEERY
jgi:hypothetical protein